MWSYRARLWLIILFGISRAVAQNAATAVSVDANASRHAINPNIYGIAYGDAHDMTTLNAPLNRWGGNSTTRYNWQIDAHSAAADWYFETYSDGSGTPAGSADTFATTTRANLGSEPLFTIPMIDYLANLGANRSTLEGFSVKKYGAQQATDPYNSDAGNGVSSATGKNITGNNPLDTGVANSTNIQQGWLQHFLATYGSAATSTGIKYYILDNEPSLWYSTHRDVHPNPPTYQEMYNKIVAYASMIRAADPAAKIVGPEEWSWWAMFASGFDQANGSSAANSDYNTHNQTYYYPWLLQQLQAYKQQTGTQLLDVLTVHCYNGAPGGSDDSLSGQQYRNRETRILWDPTFQDPSWYGDIGINGRVINWIPTLKGMVSQYYPGIQIGCTEYNWGDEPNLNGATTQADVLGIYGREGFDLATRWTVAKNTGTNPTTYYVTYLASQIYRNYDGNNSAFGETSVAANVSNPDNLSAFASIRESDGALTVMLINKQQGSTPVTLSLANFSTAGTAQVWQINSASQTTIARLANLNVANNSVSTTAPSQSITLFVIPAGSTLSPPGAPTGLAASVGNGTVTLTWNATGGATSYAVKRGITSGGPYSTVATVGGSPTSFTDSGLTNGTTYYYVLTGSNSGGTSPNSAELSATPLAPPTFTSSATANPNPVTQGASTTISATVNDTANTLTNGVVQIAVLDPTGATALTQNFAGQNFASGQSHSYQVNLVPTLAGAYTVEIGVYSATNQLWNWNSSAATITANSNFVFKSTATPNPSAFAPGATTNIAVSVTDIGTGGLANSIVELQVFDKSGNAAMTTYWTGQNFTAGQTLQFSYTWNSSVSLTPGVYSVDIGVFDSTWAHNYYWNGSAGSITISNSQAPPAAVSVAPASGSGSSQTFTATFSDAAGASDILAARVVINSSLSGTSGCFLYFYGGGANVLYLLSDAGALQSGIRIGSPGTLSNSQCSVNTAASSAVFSGNTLTLNLALTFAPAFSGAKNIYLEAQNATVLGGWLQLGAWTVAGSSPPTPVSMTPSSGSGSSQSFTAVFSDAAGASDILAARVVINSSLSGTNSCFLYFYGGGANLLYLLTDAGAFPSGIRIGSPGTLSNSQCTVNAGNSTAVFSGNTLTLNLALTFSPAFSGAKNIYLEAQNATLFGPWLQMGAWSVAGSSPPAAVSITPSSGSAVSQTFATVFSDTAGASDILAARVLVNSSFSGTNGCFLYFYGGGANVLYLLSDAGTFQSGVPIGSPGTLSNSQCSVNAAASSALFSGNTLTLNLALTFAPGFAGAKNIYLEAQNATVFGAWTQSGAWIVP